MLVRILMAALCMSLLCLGALISEAVERHPSALFTGCYSDLKLIENEGVVIGSGSLMIKRVHGKYTATFVELMHDGGEYYPQVPVRNLAVDQAKGRITFDLVLHQGKVTQEIPHVTGKVSDAGIKMNWRGRAALYGRSNPFMRRMQGCK